MSQEASFRHPFSSVAKFKDDVRNIKTKGEVIEKLIKALNTPDEEFMYAQNFAVILSAKEAKQIAILLSQTLTELS